VIASFRGKTIVLGTRKNHKIGWFSVAPMAMRCEAKPKPARFVLRSGLTVWFTDHEENLPTNAETYYLESGHLFTSLPTSADCRYCGTKIEFNVVDGFPDVLTCDKCGKKTSITWGRKEAVRCWGGEFKTFVSATVKPV
jgi:hypothetical protein